ncbi:MAG: hypothetical protein DHS20C15_29550 [Planctomycetota bacterium]|nr:MAG: hypothetical protein DHS20C15_29550 [Planctomycetota bacterium]
MTQLAARPDPLQTRPMDSSPEPDQTLQLVHRAQAGDREALDALFARYEDRVRAIVRMRLGRRLRQRVESGDILQNTFMAALEGLDRFEVRNEASFIAWLSRIAEYQIRDAADFHRAAKRDLDREQMLPPGPEELGRLSEQGEHAPAAEALADDAEQRSLVEDCVAGLPEPQRELIILRDYVGAAWKQIAEETGCPSADAARMRHATAMVALAKSLRTAQRP